MRCITLGETEAWLTDRRYSLEARPTRVRAAAPSKDTSIDIPKQSARQAVLSNLIARVLNGDPEILIWITAWGIGPSEENWPLFTGFRLLHGERRRLIDAPGHIFGSNESEYLASLIRLILVFGWDAYVAHSCGELLVFLSHDEIADFYACSDRISAVLDMNLKQNNFVALNI